MATEEEVKLVKQKLRLTLQEYSERLNRIKEIRKNVEIGGTCSDDIYYLCDISVQALLNSQIVALDRIFPKLRVIKGACPSCKNEIRVMTVGDAIAWACDRCGTSSNRNYRIPEMSEEELPTELATDAAEQILLALQRKKKDR